MKRITLSTVLVACGLLATSAPLFAQNDAQKPADSAKTTEAAKAPEAPPTVDWFSGNISTYLLGRDDVGSAKFQEYRIVPKGLSVPFFDLQGSQKGTEFAFRAKNVFQDDQRYTGGLNTDWVGLAFDFNQIPHNMGYNGEACLTETAPGVWSMSSMLRNSLANAVESTPTAGRTY